MAGSLFCWYICYGLQVSSTYKYIVRKINPKRKSEHITKVWHNVDKKFATCKELKLKLIETFEDKLPNFSELKCGFLEKGSKCWVEDDDDLEAMYEIFDSADEITIWCEGRLSEEQRRKKDAGKKRKLEDADSNDTRKKAGGNSPDFAINMMKIIAVALILNLGTDVFECTTFQPGSPSKQPFVFKLWSKGSKKGIAC